MWKKHQQQPIKVRGVGLGRTRRQSGQFQAREGEECRMAKYRTRKEKKPPQWRQHLKATSSCISDGSRLLRHVGLSERWNLWWRAQPQKAPFVLAALVLVVALTRWMGRRWGDDKRCWKLNKAARHQACKHADRRSRFCPTQHDEFLTSAPMFGLWSVGATLYLTLHPHTSTFVQVCLYREAIWWLHMFKWSQKTRFLQGIIALEGCEIYGIISFRPQ